MKKIVEKLTSVVIEITDKCNLQCRHCMNRPDSVGIETDIEQLSFAIEKINRFGVDKIYFSGGEPLLHKSIIDIIDLCKDYPIISFVITTNGLLLTSEIMKAIEKHKNLTLQFSIDGTTASTYEYLRGKGTFEQFIDKIKIWDTSNVQYGLARTCISKDNYKEIENIYEFCLSHRLIPSFLFADALGNAKSNWDQLDTTLAEKIWCINTINRLNNKYNYSISPPEAPATCNFTEGAGICSLLIRANGRVAPCQFFYDDSVGNIFTDEIEDILSHERISQYIEIARERKEILEKGERCKSCKVKAGCHYGCMGKANNLGNILSYDGECELRIMTAICYSNHLITLNENAIKQNSIHPFEENVAP